jgi:DNA-binding XRE family transcriptional regulator
MDKQEVINLLSSKMKLIRIEKGYTQDKMAEVLGISKKTLVQLKKGGRRRTGRKSSRYARYFVIAKLSNQCLAIARLK